jgi:hypothetical protein
VHGAECKAQEAVCRERERKRGERREKAIWDISAIASAVAYWLFSLLQD